MGRLKRYAAALLVGALTLALLTPVYLIIVRPGSAIYHRNWFVLVSQILPYAVCAAIWLPSRNPAAPRIALWLSGALFAAACLLYVPVFVDPSRVGGDMVGLAYIAVCVVTTAGVIAISVIAWIVALLRQRARRSPETVPR